MPSGIPATAPLRAVARSVASEPLAEEVRMTSQRDPVPVPATGTRDVTADVFRTAMRRQVTGVTIITAQHQGRAWGMTVSAFTSVCAEPPTVLVCVDRRSVLSQAISADERFAANLLSQDQEFLSRLCSRRGTPKYVDDYCLQPDELDITVGAPVLRDSLVSFDCVLRESHVMGSHLVCFGEVLGVITPQERLPLLYGAGRYHEPTDLYSSAWRTQAAAWA